MKYIIVATIVMVILICTAWGFDLQDCSISDFSISKFNIQTTCKF